MRQNNYFITLTVITFSILCMFASHCYGANLNAFIADDQGAPVEFAVVTATATSSTINSKKPADVIIDQVDKEFITYVTAIQAGTTVMFPNNDKIRHHIYSFSEVKKFEIPLYPPGVNADNKVLFDKPGVVVIGCNIHDWMKAYIYVVETPYFATSDSKGNILINDLPDGQYDVAVWHPNLAPKTPPQTMKVSVGDKNEGHIKFTLRLTQQWRSRRAPIFQGNALYR
ncbi:MAG: methylamine utilization protein [Candidatus Magnetominusculus sp. LBB02]|nr:methylamine utilization protein [Candidatus Magnetominusculus sp. LBB02]